MSTIGGHVILVFLLTLTAATSSAYELTLSVSPNHTVVEMTCVLSAMDKDMRHSFKELRITKLSMVNSWHTVASVGRHGSVQTIDSSATAFGKIKLRPSKTVEMKVTWPLMTPCICGKYKCEFVGMDDVRDISTTAELGVSNAYAESLQLQYIGLELEKDSKRKGLGKSEEAFSYEYNSVMEMVRFKLNSIECNMLEKFKGFESLVESIASTDEETSGEDNIIANEQENILWPEGSFTLLMPDTGCPGNPHAWNKGFMKFAQVHPERFFPANQPLHLPTPYTHGFNDMNQHFCSLPDSEARQLPWPKGSYCIHKMATSECPNGFHSSKLQVDIKDSYKTNFWYGHLPGSAIAYWYWLDFCCRHDGCPLTAIDLPISKPFYLFRHNGTCQKVKGMDITQDQFIVATETDTENDDKWMPGHESAYRPDVSLDPVNEELCYYSKTRN